MKKAIWILILVVFAGVLVFRAMTVLNEKKAAGAVQGGQRATPVVIGTPRQGTLAVSLEQNGVIAAASDITLYSRLSGKLVRNLVRTGDIVQADQVLAIVDRDETGYEYKQHEVRTAQRGVVVRTFLNPGALVNPNTPIVQVVDIETVKAIVGIPEDRIRFIVAGKRGTLLPDAFPGAAFAGVVTVISPVANPQSRTIDVELELQNPRHLLKPGMSVKARFLLQSRTALLAPLAAVIEREGVRNVFVVRDSVAVLRPVRTGETAADSVEILQGIRTGEHIVVSGAQRLNDGDRITAAR